MNEFLDLFAEPESQTERANGGAMSPEQRAEVRLLFRALGTHTAREQFRVVEELLGIRLSSPDELPAISAARLIERLRKRVVSHERSSTGSVWADRDEDTWIDRL